MPQSLIRARGLTKKFGDFTAVNGIDFDVVKGESFGLLGLMALESPLQCG